MADDASGPEPQPEVPAEAGEKQSQTDKPEPKTFDEAYVKELRQEAAKYRKAAQEATAKITEFEDRDKSELEKLQSKLADAETERSTATRTQQELRVENTILRAAAQHGISKPDTARKLLDWSRIEFDEDGAPQNVSTLLEELVKEEPTLLGAQTPVRDFDSGPRSPAPDPQTPEEAHRAFVMKVLGQPQEPT